MQDPCFCHFNGFAVKDAAARQAIEEEAKARADLEYRVSNCEQLENENRRGIVEEAQARAQDKEELEQMIVNEYTERAQAIENLKTRKFLIIGDSYTAGSQLAEGQKTWADWFREYMGLSEDSCIVYAKGGALFGIEEGSEFAFSTLLQTAANEMTAEARNGITDIIVFGGANDWSHTESDIVSGMVSFTTISGVAFPNAKKWLFCAGWSFNPVYRKGLKYAYLYYSRNGGKYGFTVFNETFRAIHNKNRMSDDEVHPNADGQLELGRVAVNCIRGGSTDTLPPVEHSVNLQNLKIGTAIVNGYCVDVHLFAQTMEFPSVDITNDFQEVASFTSDVLAGADPAEKQEGTFTANVILNGHTANRTGASLIFKIVKKDVKTTALYAKSLVLDDAGNFKTYPNVTGLAFCDTHFTVPIWYA